MCYWLLLCHMTYCIPMYIRMSDGGDNNQTFCHVLGSNCDILMAKKNDEELLKNELNCPHSLSITKTRQFSTIFKVVECVKANQLNNSSSS